MSDSFDHSPPAASQPPYFRVPHSIKSSHILVGIADFGLEKDISPCSMCGRRDFSAGGHFGRWRLFVERNFRLFDLVVL